MTQPGLHLSDATPCLAVVERLGHLPDVLIRIRVAGGLGPLYTCTTQLLGCTDMSRSIKRQAERLYDLFAELVRGYQFRDREGICCHGLSVSQCHTLDLLDRRGPMTMGELAGSLYLEVSTMTRVVDQLVLRQLASRAADPKDRRVCRILITRKGRSLLTDIRAELIAEHEMVLRNVAPGSREAVISAVSHLLSAFNERQRARCADECCGIPRRRSEAG